MPSVPGVVAYVAKTYKQRAKEMRELHDNLDLWIEDRARRAWVSEKLLIIRNLSEDLGSMRRLLGDLRHDELVGLAGEPLRFPKGLP